MNTFSRHKIIACIIISTYLSCICAPGSWAAQHPATSQLLAQGRGLTLDDPDAPKQAAPRERLSSEERKARKAILTGKMQRLEEDMNGQRGMRKNFLNIAVGAFAIGATLAYGVNQVNAAIDDIAAENPENNPEGCVEERVSACDAYVSYTEEKRDAQDALDGIKGIGGGIFIVGIASVIGYAVYTYAIRGKQHTIEALRVESETLFEARGLTPDYLRRNESVAAVVAEMDLLKKKAGSTRTKSELFLRVALGAFSSGLFLFGLSNVAHTLVGNISIDEGNAADVTAKDDALDETDALKNIGGVFMGVGVASGVTSYVFAWLAKGQERQINNLEDSLWRVAERIDFQPKMNGFQVRYTYAF